MEDGKKLTVSKIIHFRAYRPITTINNDSEENVPMQETLLPTKSTLHQSDAFSSITPAKEPGAAANKISKKKKKYPSIQ